MLDAIHRIAFQLHPSDQRGKIKSDCQRYFQLNKIACISQTCLKHYNAKTTIKRGHEGICIIYYQIRAAQICVRNRTE